jgi:hypothetical protein
MELPGRRKSLEKSWKMSVMNLPEYKRKDSGKMKKLPEKTKPYKEKRLPEKLTYFVFLKNRCIRESDLNHPRRKKNDQLEPMKQTLSRGLFLPRVIHYNTRGKLLHKKITHSVMD